MILGGDFCHPELVEGSVQSVAAVYDRRATVGRQVTGRICDIFKELSSRTCREISNYFGFVSQMNRRPAVDGYRTEKRFEEIFL